MAYLLHDERVFLSVLKTTELVSDVCSDTVVFSERLGEQFNRSYRQRQQSKRFTCWYDCRGVSVGKKEIDRFV